jgi:hypothetical protein
LEGVGHVRELYCKSKGRVGVSSECKSPVTALRIRSSLRAATWAAFAVPKKLKESSFYARGFVPFCFQKKKKKSAQKLSYDYFINTDIFWTTKQ